LSVAVEDVNLEKIRQRLTVVDFISLVILLKMLLLLGLLIV
jgi:hypothetical protein